MTIGAETVGHRCDNLAQPAVRRLIIWPPRPSILVSEVGDKYRGSADHERTRGKDLSSRLSAWCRASAQPASLLPPTRLTGGLRIT
jgi:hypothetical protein